jgi:hypothetical protein
MTAKTDLPQKVIAQRSRNQKEPPCRRIGEKTSSQKNKILFGSSTAGTEGG